MSTHKAPKRGLFSAAVGILGELLITAGAFLLLFVVWQLWWTDVVADREHAAILQQLEDTWGPTPPKVGKARTDEPPAVKKVPENEVWGAVHVPAFDKPTSPLAEGVSLEKVLNVIGNGHYPETAMPGEVGNFSFAGHRSTYGRPLHDIARLKKGDPVIIEGPDAYYVYKVTDTQIVKPNDVQVIAPVPGKPGEKPTKKMLTMTACHPMYSVKERYIVHAEYDHWVSRKDGIPQEMAQLEGMK